MIAEIRDLQARLATLERSLQRPTQEIRDDGDLRLRWGRQPDGSWTYQAFNAEGLAGDLADADIVGRMVWRIIDGDPPGWLRANGQTVTSAYPVLRGLLLVAGSPYGASGGDPRLPDLVQKFVRGAGNVNGPLGGTGGADTVTLTGAQMPTHGHAAGGLAAASAGAHSHATGNGQAFATHVNGTANTQPGSGSPTITNAVASTNSAGAHGHTITGSTANAGSGQGHENRPPFVNLAPLVRAY